MIKIVTIIFTLLLSQMASGAERYLSGIPVPLRAEPDRSSRLLQLLPAGEYVSLGNESKNGFTLITTNSGVRGWVTSRYLTKRSPLPATAKSSQIESNQKQMKIKLENSRLKTRITSIQQEKRILESEIQKLKESSHRANQEVDTIRDISESALEMENENHLLRDQVRVQKRDLEALQQENKALQDRKDRDWFLVGSMVSILALLIGFSISRMRGGNNRGRARI
ncbi:MAG: TIGR04211 family SH3 domain-containing protein [Gammaproteobacteria bacterium]|uniref:TIGR04211 family SH3 domain-containing protein n=1 Tax=Candidatus Thiopontia autotrophica TaxID=2841688 RepID=A0A8J6PAA2_9GAMM|nr:TIGR04211 family SH3 domain-containing protein [Candidatus Thiopontia autotrophica]